MGKSKVYIKMFLSYLGMLLLPILLGTVIYAAAFNVMKEQSAKMNENMLEMVRRQIDQRMAEINKIASRLAMDSKIQKASMVKGKFQTDDQFMLYDIFKDLSNQSVSENFISDIFIYFKNTKTVSSIKGTMSLDLYYKLYYENKDYSMEEFADYIGRPHYADSAAIHREKGGDILLFTMSNLGMDLKDASATVCIAVKFSDIEKILSSMAWNDQMGIMIIDENNQVIGIGPGSLLPGLTYEDFHAFSTGNIVNIRQSEVNKWKYISVIPVSVIEKDIRDVRKIAVLGLFLCIAAGFWISYYLTKKSYNPLKSMMKVFKKYSNDEIKAGENEYQWLNEQVDRFFKEQVDAKRLMCQNQKNLKAYYLSQLLHDSYNSNMDHLKQYDICLDGSYNRAIYFIFKNMDLPEKSYEMCAQENALRKFILINILEETLSNYVQVELVEMGENVAAVISGKSEEPEQLNILREHIEQVQQMIEERFDFAFAVLIGPSGQGLGRIHALWQQTLELESYINLLDTDLISFEGVKDIQPQYHYSMEAEQKIINGIKVGDKKAAKENMEQVFAENFHGKVSTGICRCLIFDMIGTLLKGANAGGYLNAAREIDFNQGFHVKQPISELKGQFFDAIDIICQKIADEQKRMAGDDLLSQKIELYIQESYQDPDLNISITSQHFNMTPAYLSSIYKKQTGRSLLDYINSVRIAHAERLLMEGKGVMEAAQMTGFRDCGTFIRVFKKKKGITPGQIKKHTDTF